MLCGSILAVVGAAFASAVDDSFALRAAAIYPVTAQQAGPIENGVILVRDGRIVAVGADLEIPPDLRLIELPDAHVCPGFVDAGGLPNFRHAGDPSVSAAFHAVEQFDPFEDYSALIADGVTAAYAGPGDHRLVSGVGAVVRLAGPHESRVLRPQADLALSLHAMDPPLLGERPTRAASDVAIEPFQRQRPSSRLSLFVELDQRIERATRESFSTDLHMAEFARQWKAGAALRIEARRGLDLAQAVRFVERHQRSAYLVGAAEAPDVLAELARARLAVVWRVDDPFDRPTYNTGDAPTALVTRLEAAAALHAAGAPVALTGRSGEATDLSLVAALAMRGGLPRAAALAGVTRVPAEILGVADRIGSLAPGRDADLLILNGPPLDLGSRVQAAYVAGRRIFDLRRVEAAIHDRAMPSERSVVVRAGTIWTGDGRILYDAELLAESGVIRAVGQRVARPAGARFIDAGSDAFITPGFIDVNGHLGLENDRSDGSPDVPLHRAIALAGEQFLRVARSGVTTVLVAPYSTNRNGSRVVAVKTWGHGRDELVAREVAAVKLPFSADPLTGMEAFDRLFDRARKYDEAWKKHEEELAKWRAGETVVTDKPTTSEIKQETISDPITGTWKFTISGGPIPEPVDGTMLLRMTGTDVEGRLQDPTSGEETPVRGTFTDELLVLEFERETPMGSPRIEARLISPGTLKGELKLGSILTLNFEATRTDAGPVEFKVVRGKRSRDGRPEPPKVEESLEPFRPVLAGKAAIVVETDSAAQVRALVDWFGAQKLPLVIMNASGATDVAELLIEQRERVGVVPSPRLRDSRDRRPYVQIVDLARRGVPVAFQSDSEDGARNLPWMAMYAVRAGMGGDAALRALTIDAARMYRIDDRLGSLEVGKDADFIIHSGHPFDAASAVRRVFVGGREAAQP